MSNRRDIDKYYTATQTAIILDVTRQTVHKWIKQKRIPARFHAGRWLVRHEDARKPAQMKMGRPKTVE